MNKFLLSTTFFCFVFLKYNLFNFLTILINRKIILIRRNLGICGSCRYFLLSESYGVENGTPDCRTLGYALATIIYRHGPELRGTGWQWLAFNAGGVWLTTPHLSAVTECVCVWSNDCAVAAAFSGIVVIISISILVSSPAENADVTDTCTSGAVIDS